MTGAVLGLLGAIAVVVLFFAIERLTEKPVDAFQERQTARRQGRKDGRESESR